MRKIIGIMLCIIITLIMIWGLVTDNTMQAIGVMLTIKVFIKLLPIDSSGGAV